MNSPITLIRLIAAASILPAIAAAAPVPAPPPAAKPAAPAKLPAATTPAKPVAPATPDGMKPYADVIKGAKESSGLFTIYKNDKGEVYLAVKPEQLDHDFILSTAVGTGLGVEGIYSGVQLGDDLVQFHRINDTVQLIDRNINFRAKPNTPQEIAIQRSFSDSVLGSLKIEAIEPKKKWLLVNVTPLFLSDLPELGRSLTAQMGAPYNVDTSRSYFDSVKSLPDNLDLEAADIFGSPKPNASAAIPDARSFQIRVHYSLYPPPPDTGYIPREADTRIGYFITAYKDLSNDSTRDPFVRYIDRWDIRKLHPDQKLSPPVHPIVYWLDDAMPVEYRPAVTEGILRWNKAFERIGIQNAIEVKQRPVNADWDISDARYNVVRWFNADEGAPAIGMHRVNPYTGQTIGATIVINDGFARYWKSYYHDYIQRLTGAEPPAAPALQIGKLGESCDYSEEAIPYFAQALNAAMLLSPDPSAPIPEKLVDQYLSEVTCHEVGHTLGLRHNFKGSTMLPFKDLFNTRLTHEYGTTNSVMDYMEPLIALPGQKQGDYYTTTIGPYDYWAIAYGYETLDGMSAEQRKTALNALASKSSSPYLQYATDEDAGSVDPTARQWDYGRDPLDFADHQIALAHALFKRIQQRLPRPGRTYDDVFSAYVSTLGMYTGAFNTPLGYIGGYYLHKDHAGQKNGRLPVQVIPASQQLRALRMLTDNLFDDSALRIPPSLLDRVLPDRWMHWDSNPFGASYNPTSLRDALLNAQHSALNSLYSPATLTRLEDQNLYADGKNHLDVAHLIDGTTWAIWSELTRSGHVDISPLRRDSQRLQLDSLITLAVHPEQGTPEDAQAMARYELQWIRSHAQQAIAHGHPDLIVKAHLQDVESRIDHALNAQMTMG
ncbi:MAG TPA: zinc-dependent metalloprotease [Armatimonadota bacterium]|nr:zinc-dependent metalloprotease [Armatimonadota bacterium]